MYNLCFISLGCNKNLVDSEVMMGLLTEAGFNIVEDEADADVLVVNTCGFINDAKEESIHTILSAARHKVHSRCKAVVVAGCLAQRYRDELLREMPEIDGIIGTGEIDKIVEVVGEAVARKKPMAVSDRLFLYNHELPRRLATPAYSAYVKIAEGCDNWCSYCAIPKIRGAYRSRPEESIIHEVEALAATGVKEIILTAQDTTRYGTDIYGKPSLAELLRKLVRIEGVEWIRLLYAYPSRINDELIEVIAAEEKVCNYLDVPIQHVDQYVIEKMNRQGNAEELTQLIDTLRSRIPGITLRTSLIVGFPGEDEEHFNNLVEFVKKVRFDRLGVFTYSQEEDTPAGEMEGQVPDHVKEQRKESIMQIQQQISLQINEEKVGSSILVLVEGKSKENQELYVGRSEADAPEIDGLVYFTGHSHKPGDMVKVKITEATEYDLIGEVTP